MSGLTTAEMSRILVVGTSDELASTLELAARLRAIHMIDHDGEVLGLGSPNEDADDISRRLATMRGCMSQLKSSPGSNLIRLDRVRESLSGSLSESMLSVSEDLTRLEDSSSELEQLAEQVELLERLDPLGLGLDLLQGYDSVSVNLGHVPLLAQCLGAIHGLSEDTYVFDAPGKGKEGTLAVFCESSSAGVVEKLLSEHAFQSIAVPEGDGLISDRISSLKTRASELRAEQDGLRAALKTWNDENGAMLVGGIEVLESDFEIETAPVRVATSEHAFIIEGWVLTEESEATVAALAEVATYVECTPFEMPRGRGHHFSEEEIELPPIAFQNIGPATPYELLTDAVGRPKYGRMDPTTFMFFTYPIFFGLMLGDIAYGLAIVGLAWWLSRKFSRNELVVQGSLLLFYIGVSTIVFGYLFGEFAGFEYLPHGHCDIEGIVGVAQCEAAHGHYHWEDSHTPGWVAWLTSLYPSGGELHWMGEVGFGINLAYPFHRVSSNLEDLIVLTMYLGMLHLALGMSIGFRDVYMEHGFVAAMFEKGSWLLVLSGGFLFIYAFLVSPNHTDPSYLDMLGMFTTVGLTILAIGIGMVIITLWKYESMPLPIAIGLGPLESLQVLSNTVSYVRLFAVGVVGVKIAETGNNMLYWPMVETLTDISQAGALDIVLVPILLIGWLAVHLFALVLGIFSPNVQAARLHFVEWMGKFYETGGEPFAPFGRKLINVEAD